MFLVICANQQTLRSQTLSLSSLCVQGYDTCIMTKLRYTVRAGWGREEARRCMMSEQMEIEGGSWPYSAATRVRASGKQRQRLKRVSSS